MTEIDEYLLAVRRFAAELTARDDGRTEIFVSGLQGNPDAEASVSIRSQLATGIELEAMRPYLDIGYFQGPDEARRLAWWLFYVDIVHAYENTQAEATCEPYRRDQALFRGAPALFNEIRRRQSAEGNGSLDYELIDEAAIRSISDSEVYAFEQGFARLVPDLAPRIPAWARSEFPHAPKYVRLDPRFWFAEEPLMLLEEAAITPANPRWIKTLALFPRQREFAAYELQDCDAKSDMAQYRDFHIRDIRRFEIFARRTGPDYLSMMLEELPRVDDPNGLMIGRCIHLDTRAPINTPMADARLLHLDLAINVYRGADRARRVADSLQNGKVVDATYRTHLYRIEDVPFPSLFVFAEMFFKSRVLVGEWLDELGITPPT